MTSESDSVTPSQQLSATDKGIVDSVPKTMQNRSKLLIQTEDSETEGLFRRHELER